MTVMSPSELALARNVPTLVNRDCLATMGLELSKLLVPGVDPCLNYNILGYGIMSDPDW